MHKKIGWGILFLIVVAVIGYNNTDKFEGQGASSISYPLNGTPLVTDQTLGIDDPSGTWAINRFSFDAIWALFESIAWDPTGAVDLSSASSVDIGTATGTSLTLSGALVANGGVSSPSATPTDAFEDSDSLDADTTIANIVANATTVTAGAVVSDMLFQFKDGGDASGAFTDAALIDGSDNQFEFLINTTLQAGDIVNAEIADDTIAVGKMADGDWGAFTVTTNVAALDANSVDSDQYVDGSIDAIHLAVDVIDETKIADDGIDSEHYNDGSIDPVHLALSAGTRTKSFAIDGATADDDFLLWKPPYAITILSINGVLLTGTSVVGGIDECDSAGATPVAVDADITFNGGNDADDGSLTNPSIDADDWVRWHTTSVSAPGYLTVTIEYTIN